MPKSCLNTKCLGLRPSPVVIGFERYYYTDEGRSPKCLVFKQLFGTFIPFYIFYYCRKYMFHGVPQYKPEKSVKWARRITFLTYLLKKLGAQ